MKKDLDAVSPLLVEIRGIVVTIISIIVAIISIIQNETDRESGRYWNKVRVNSNIWTLKSNCQYNR